MYSFQAKLAGGGIAVGLDEVGRGPVAARLPLAPLCCPDAPRVEGVNDSKQLSAERREEIAAVVREVAIAWDIEYIQPQEIDEHGMTWALRTANSCVPSRPSRNSFSAKGTSLDAVLLDGNAQHLDAREVNIVKGDGKCASIAAASIIARSTVTRSCAAMPSSFPITASESNKGYASAEHIEAIKQYGLFPCIARVFAALGRRRRCFKRPDHPRVRKAWGFARESSENRRKTPESSMKTKKNRR